VSDAAVVVALLMEVVQKDVKVIGMTEKKKRYCTRRQISKKDESE
jgi:hypothetical protein